MSFVNNNNELDNLAFNVLLLLSGGQKLTFKDISLNTGQPSDQIRVALQTLLVKKLATTDTGRYVISYEGVEFLSKRGYPATGPGDDPSPDSFRNKIKVMFFGSWNELGQWLIFPIFLLFVAFMVWMVYTMYKHDPNQPHLGLLCSVAFALIFLFVFLYIRTSWRNVGETENMVVFRLGKLAGVREAGPALIVPFLDKTYIVDTREKSKEIKDEPCLTRDKILVRMGLLITWEIDDPAKSLMKVVDAEDTMHQFTIAVLRAAVSEFTLEQILENRNGLANLIRVRLEKTVGEWGLSINSLEIRDTKPPEGFLQTIQQRFIASIESETTLTKTDTQVEALRRLFQIGSRLDQNTFKLKYLETLTKIGEGPSTKYIIPMEFVHLLGDWLQAQLSKTNHNK